MLLAARRASIDRRPDLERLTTPFLLALMTYYVTGMFLHLSFGAVLLADARGRRRGRDHHAARDGRSGDPPPTEPARRPAAPPTAQGAVNQSV